LLFDNIIIVYICCFVNDNHQLLLFFFDFLNMDTNGLLIVQRIDSVLKKRGETRVQLAQALGIKAQNISAWYVRGTIPGGDVCLKIARYLGVGFEWLITGEDEGQEGSLSGEEQELLSSWRELAEHEKAAVLAMIGSFLKSKAAKVPADSVG
jgi:transcriptional regulator with XRE-family HTH domain